MSALSVRVRRWWSLIGAVATSGVFLSAALFKVTDSLVVGTSLVTGPDLFAHRLGVQGLVPTAWTTHTAYAVLALEASVGLGLLFQRTRRVSAWLAWLLLAAFSTYIVIVFRNQGTVDCGCFGRIGGSDLQWVLVRNAVLAAVLVGPAIPMSVVPRDGGWHDSTSFSGATTRPLL